MQLVECITGNTKNISAAAIKGENIAKVKIILTNLQTKKRKQFQF